MNLRKGFVLFVVPAAFALLVACSTATTSLGTAPTYTPRLNDLSQCKTWIAGRAWSSQRSSPELKLISPWVACYDGTLEAGLQEGLVAWAASEPPGSRSKALVIRSRGGDAAVGLAVAEALHKTRTHVYVTQICASSCANYIFAGVADRHVIDKAAILFHGGYSPKTRAHVIEQFETFIRSPGGQAIEDPAENRLQVLRDFDAKWERQRRLYHHAGVKNAVVERVDAIDFRKIEAENCGGDIVTSRNFVFFGSRQLSQLGISIKSGWPATTSADVNGTLKGLGADFVACMAPTWFFGE